MFAKHRNRLRMETLEERTLMAGDTGGGQSPGNFPAWDYPETQVQAADAILDFDGTLRVYGTSGNDHITIGEGFFKVSQWDVIEYPGVEVTITDDNGNLVLSETFLFKNYQVGVSLIKVYAGAGDDLVENNTGFASILYGGAGDDTLYGGWGDDELFGQEDNDGLFGGVSGTDYYDPGLGDDRLLVVDGWGNKTFSDYNVTTTKRSFISFVHDAAASTGEEEFPSEPFTYQAGQWTLSEVKKIDDVLRFLHHKQGNSSLLRDVTGGNAMMTLHRAGLQDPHSSGITRTAFNEGGDITLSSNLFAQGPNWITQTFLHEIGHNWDEENPQWDTFKAISGWTDVDPSSSDHTASLDGQWWHDTSASFARHYGHKNPLEDFATAFEAYFMHEMGLPFQGTWEDAGNVVGHSVIPEKIAFLDNWAFGMSADFFDFNLVGEFVGLDLLGRSDRSEDSQMRSRDDDQSAPSDTRDYHLTATSLPRVTDATSVGSVASRALTDAIWPEAVDLAISELFVEDTKFSTISSLKPAQESVAV